LSIGTREEIMRIHARLAIAAAAALFLMSAPALTPAQAFSPLLDVGSDVVLVAAGDCAELRAACEQKNQLGERGEGNCRRYRETCQRPRRDVCAELRSACLNKNRLGEQGEGNCRKYRETCRR
jgi:hypothetical protein